MHRSILILFVLFVWLEGRVAQQDDGAFRDLAPPGLFVGSVFHGYSPTWQEPDYQTLALREFNFMTSSIYLPTVWQDPSQEINVQPFAQVCSFLRENNILVHGHALLYPAIATIADWWNEQSLDNVENRMYQYMTAVVTAGRGLVETWDVVNEVMGDDNNDMDEDGVRRSLFNGKPIKEYQAMGQDYVKKAFQFARQADSNARLLLTDYGIEEDDPENENQKSDRLYRFVSKLLAEGVTIDGIGFQMHVGSQDGNPDYLAIARNFERFRKLGLLIYITEMDVASYETSIRYNVTRPPELDRASRFQGRVYRRVLEICLVEPACQGFRFWDYAEYNSRVPDLRYSWLHPITHDESRLGIYTYPSPFWDINPNNFSPKRGWLQMKDAMKDFAENEGGIYRMASKWDTSNSYVGRVGSLNDDGTYSPSNSVNLYELNEGSEMWSSLKWRLERVEDSINVYRIKNMWANSYLTRTGEQDKYGEWYPAYGVVLADLHSSWWSQQWVIEHTGEATFKIRCLWGNSNDYMTRLGAPDGVGGYLPTNEIRLQRDENYSSQHWLLYRTL